MVRDPGVRLAKSFRYRWPRLVVSVDLRGDIGPPCLATPLTMIGSVRPCAVRMKTLVFVWAALSMSTIAKGHHRHVVACRHRN
jgi:hypothetical protein